MQSSNNVSFTFKISPPHPLSPALNSFTQHVSPFAILAWTLSLTLSLTDPGQGLVIFGQSICKGGEVGPILVEFQRRITPGGENTS